MVKQQQGAAARPRGAPRPGSIPFVIRGDTRSWTYASRTTVLQEARSRLGRLCGAGPLKGAEPEAYKWLVGLFAHHPGAEEKLRDLQDVRVVEGVFGKGHAIELLQHGTWTKISFHKCIHPKSYDGEMKSALRKAINHQIVEFRAGERGREPCSFCGSKKKPHVDHVVEFDALVEGFFRETGVAAPESLVPEEWGRGLGLEHRDLEVAFSDYHRRHAQLRILCEECNLKRPKAKTTLAYAPGRVPEPKE